MSRIVNTDSPSAQRQRLRRTIAEALNRLMAKQELDDETRDLAALIVFSLREIDAGIERSATAWDKRHYYIKADRLRQEWEWASRVADRMANLIKGGDWARLPVLLASLAPRFSDVQVSKLTRSPGLWAGAYRRLKDE
ncbi:MAG: hypothetical protein ACK2T6_09460 [Anaerolineae bacterium]|jgi:hypothetical protein